MTDGSHSARLLRTRRYGVFWFTSLLSNIGTWMQSVAEPWLLLSIGGSSFLLGLDAFAMNAPFWILAHGPLRAEAETRATRSSSTVKNKSWRSSTDSPGMRLSIHRRCL